jgi:hypothetical protein
MDQMVLQGERVSLRSYKAALAILSVLGLLSIIVLNEDLIPFTNDYTEESRIARALGKKKKKSKTPPPPPMELIWLLGYPGAGSESVMISMEFATQSSMGTNYGNQMFTKRREMHVNKYPSVLLQKSSYKHGPFKNNIDYDIKSNSVLVRTHCTGYCFIHNQETGTCSRIGYIRSLMDVAKFSDACAKGSSYKPTRKNKKVKGTKSYWAKKVKKVVVLVRNPLDILISRYDNHMRKQGMKPSKVDFYGFCDGYNKHWGKVKEIRKAVRTLRRLNLPWEDTPCAPEFFRIYVWYNNVYQIAKEKEHIVVRFEDLVTDVEKNMNRIVDFAGLKVENPKGFLRMTDDVHTFWVTDEERAKILSFMKALAAKNPSMMNAYFDGYF